MAGWISVDLGSIRVSVESVALLCASVDLRVQLISVDFWSGFSSSGEAVLDPIQLLLVGRASPYLPFAADTPVKCRRYGTPGVDNPLSEHSLPITSTSKCWTK